MLEAIPVSGRTADRIEGPITRQLKYGLLAAGLIAAAAAGFASQAEAAAGVAVKVAPSRSASPIPQVFRDRLPRIDPRNLRPGDATLRGTFTGPASRVPGSPDGKRKRRSGKSGNQAQAFGTAKMPYTTQRVMVTELGTPSDSKFNTPVTSYPFSATGKILATFPGGQGFICTGSLIGPGLLVTAAHCIHNFGQGDAGFATDVKWQPSHFANAAGKAQKPYGTYSWKTAAIPSTYHDGTDTCEAGSAGVVCNNDIAIVILKPRDGQEAGEALGWYGYGTNGFSYVQSPTLGNKTVVHITQLGYPKAFDKGFQMIRTDAVGFRYNVGQLRNTKMGSAQTGGSSGGPWLVNFGTPPDIKLGEDAGEAANDNIVVGVTSWGFTDTVVNEQGSSFFGQNLEYPQTDVQNGGWGAGNLGFLVNFFCSDPAFAASCP